MGKPRTPIGTHGAISVHAKPNGRVQARTRYRDWDGSLRSVQATGRSRAAAERALKAKLADRSLVQPAFTTLTADSPFGDLVAYWLADLDLEGHLAPSTRESSGARRTLTMSRPCSKHCPPPMRISPRHGRSTPIWNPPVRTCAERGESGRPT